MTFICLSACSPFGNMKMFNPVLRDCCSCGCNNKRRATGCTPDVYARKINMVRINHHNDDMKYAKYRMNLENKSF